MKEVPLSQGKVALVDDEDYELVYRYKWHALYSGNVGRDVYYARRTYRDGNSVRAMLMHRLIMNPPDGLEVDHINGDGLDNRRENLRLATPHQNRGNARCLNPNKSSRFKGVSWDKYHSKWKAQTFINGRHVVLGHFTNEEEAAEAYDRMAKQYFGEYAHLNAP